jgi:hypothetical protein
MLKRSGALLLLLLYLVTGIGFVINLHYCGKLITSVKIDTTLKSCKESGMMTGMKCCKNKRIDIKIKDAHKSQAPTLLSRIFSFRLTAINLRYMPIIPVAVVCDKVNYRGPPERLCSGAPIFLKNQNFRI